ncbi:hypothetical protein M9458_039357, partial [Cirrhinus mrigala]
NLVQPHLADVSQHDPEPSQPPPRLAEPEPEPTADREPELKATEPSPKGATALWIATDPEPSLFDQVREPALWNATANDSVEREGAVESTAHCTAAEGEKCLDLGQLNMELDLIDFTKDIEMELPACHELSACLDFPPTLPLLSPPIISAASVPPPLSPDSPSAHTQPTICAVGSPQVCQSPSASWLEDPSSPPPASESQTRPRPSDPAASPRLSAPSSPPSPVGPPAPPGSIVPPSSALPPPWLLPLSAIIMAAVWVSPGSSCSESLLSPPWLLPPSSPPWTSFVVLLPGVHPSPEPPPTLTFCYLPTSTPLFLFFSTSSLRCEVAPSGMGV